MTSVAPVADLTGHRIGSLAVANVGSAAEIRSPSTSLRNLILWTRTARPPAVPGNTGTGPNPGFRRQHTAPKEASSFFFLFSREIPPEDDDRQGRTTFVSSGPVSSTEHTHYYSVVILRKCSEIYTLGGSVKGTR